ncbi:MULTISPECIES: ClpP family protease [Kribbella]|uniref:ATP-dependent Clp protease proteolytic subunit n=1 Tax=Kribbella pratensis TaxID=2512112 RepID=A0ABY2F650_9ACTN|nr:MULTISPECIES: ATP-dependent Clp protease proteolytic subunit [Kribbella]TDW83852.1 ATP-dependent Clp endopeptidase proteolytic subunit ClpP [Kribbella pratensis]TDW92388.1 ATP-dependent Clp endopeptidase proteolytic subunit ClpP [Kribbella sp. VKM Ac-2566]
MYVEQQSDATVPGQPGIPGRPWPEIPGVPRPGVPGTPERPAPQPILPSWYEPTSITLERELADRLLAERVILIGGRLDDLLANHIASQLLLLNAQGNDPVTLHLSSTESDLEAALSVAAAIDLITAPVNVVARGTVRGPAIAVLAAAEEREAHRHTTFVLSAPRFTAEGTADELATFSEEHDHQAARLRDLIAHATDRPADEVAADLETGRVLTAEDAQAYGLITRLR